MHNNVLNKYSFYLLFGKILLVIYVKALLIGVTTKYDRYNIDYSLKELKSLAEVLDYEVVETLTQNLDKPVAATYVGSGKLAEAEILVHALDIDTVIFNDELSPAQLRNAQEILKVNVIDRSYLILQIFELRASSSEAKLEIKLARDLYTLPRIAYMKGEQSRIGGGAGTATRGAGETQREMDRRHLIAEITRLKREIEYSKKTKENQLARVKRNDLPIVALVGYTNAGKSTTMNTILSETGINDDM